MSVNSRGKLFTKLKNKKYRDAYVMNHVKTSLPIQARLIREQHGWTQEEIANRMKTTQTVISRLEDPNYGNLTLNSLFKLVSAFDMGLLVKIVPFTRLLHEFQDLSPDTLSVNGFLEELLQLEAWAKEGVDRFSPHSFTVPSFAEDSGFHPIEEEMEGEVVKTASSESQSTPLKEAWGRIFPFPGTYPYEPQGATIQGQLSVSVEICAAPILGGLHGQILASAGPTSAAQMALDNGNKAKMPDTGTLATVATVAAAVD